jgi:hypothetical protein
MEIGTEKHEDRKATTVPSWGWDEFDQLGEIRKRAGEAIDLVHHHDVDLSGPEIGEQALQGGAIEGSISGGRGSVLK